MGASVSLRLSSSTQNGIEPAKSIAGCSKYSIKIGVNVALETVRGRWESRDISIDELSRYADIDQVFSVMRSYFEGVAA